MCLDIRKEFYWGCKGSINERYFSSENAGFQSWCADMWAVNFSLWKRGKITNVTPLLDFSWATDTAETYHKKPIFHNAGATSQASGLFYKGSWIGRSPIGQDLKVKEGTASSFYAKAIMEVK